MKCPKCGGENINGSTFCIKCGVNLKQFENVTQDVTQNVTQDVVQNVVQNQPSNNNQQKFDEVKKTALNYFKYAKDVLLKPYETFKNKEVELTDTKNSLVFSGIVSVIMMLVTFITTIFSSIIVQEISEKTYKEHTVIKFSNLGDLNYLTLIGRNLLVYAGIILAIALIYYIVSLMFKKDTKFTKLLSISATSVIPFIALGMIVSPILDLIWYPLALITKIGGLVYSILVFISLIKEEVSFDNKDMEIRFHLICLTILGTIGYYIYTKLFMVTINNELNDFMNMFNW